MRDRGIRSGTELAREIQLTYWSIAGEQGKFHQAITGAFHNGKKLSFDCPNYTSIQVFQFKISVKKKRRKEIRFGTQNLFA